jgi:hypothetical protein
METGDEESVRNGIQKIVQAVFHPDASMSSAHMAAANRAWDSLMIDDQAILNSLVGASNGEPANFKKIALEMRNINPLVARSRAVQAAERLRTMYLEMKRRGANEFPVRR